tara:strand:+ start:5363 stop:6442 length:1080 start_codon:yes stop_codon:yes gene_type:complete
MSNYKEEQLNNLLKKFSVPEKPYRFKPLTDGLINDTYLVFENQTPLYILQRINHKVFTNVAGLMNNVQDAFEHLNDDHYQQITLVKTLTGESYLSTEDKEKAYWRVMTYIDGSTAYNTTTESEIAFEAGKVIAKFNMLLLNAQLDKYVDTIPQFHDLKLRTSQFQEALENAPKEKLSIAANAVSFSHKVIEKLRNVNVAELPDRICHNDTKLNNILFSKETKKALCLIDLDTLMKGKFMYDFGDAVRTIVNTAPEDEIDHDQIVFEKELFSSFVKGLAANGPFLSQKEVETLPWGAVLMPFLHGLRALTDYLNGDVYYKVAYKNQNLDRSLSLLNFTEKALAHFAFMSDTINATIVPKN